MNVKGQKVEYDMLFITTCPEDVQHVGCINVICIELSRTDFLSHVRLDYSNRGKKLPILPQGNHPWRFIEFLLWNIRHGNFISSLYFQFKIPSRYDQKQELTFLDIFLHHNRNLSPKAYPFLLPRKRSKDRPTCTVKQILWNLNFQKKFQIRQLFLKQTSFRLRLCNPLHASTSIRNSLIAPKCMQPKSPHHTGYGT